MNKLSIYIVSVFLLFAGAQARAVDYQLPDLNGQMQSLDQYKGKWVVINYWATWCNTCTKELPDLIALYEDHKDGDVAVVGINFEDISFSRLNKFVKKHAIPYAILRTEPVRKTPLGPVPALPATYIVDPNGEVVAGQVGLVTKEDLESFIAAKKKLTLVFKE